MPQSHAPKRKAAENPQQIRKKPRTDGPASEFRTVSASIVLSLPPVFAARYREGAEEMLDSMVMRYQPALGGVVLAHQNLSFLSSAGRIKADNPFAVFNVGFDATVWRPEIGMRLTGNMSLCSPDHVSLLVHRTFNVSIPRHHIQTENWEFEYGPAENDPEFGAKTDGEAAAPEAQEGEEAANRGTWIHKVTAEPLGGRKGRLEFTVVGLTIANNMLSLVGSLQPDPLSDRHVAQPAALSAAPVVVSDDEEYEADEAGEKDGSGSDDEEDEATAVAAAARAEIDRKEAKRRRKEEKAKEREQEEAKAAKKSAKRKKTA